MGLETNLHRRANGVYYVRMKVPKALRELRAAKGLPEAKQSEIWKSTGARDLASARRCGTVLRGELFADFDAELMRLSDAALSNSPARVSEPRASRSVSIPAVPRLRAPVLSEPLPVMAHDPVPCAPSGLSLRPRLLSELHEAYLAEEHAGIVSSSLASRRATLRLFIEVAGDRPLDEYTREHAAAFRRQLPKLPKDAGRHFPGFSDLQAIEAAPSDFPRITKKTVNDRLSILSAFGKWLERTQSGFSSETFNLQRFKRPKGEKQVVKGFTDEEVARILGCPAFTGCRSEKDQQSPGTYRIRDYRFWVPMLAAYTGARLNEITQLRVEDVVTVNGIACLSIADEHEAQSLKSANARRLVPLHSALLEAGFLTYVEQARLRGWEWVFEDVEPDRDGRRSWVAGKRFRVLLERLEIGGEGRGGLHRFRHAAVDRMRAAGAPRESIAAVVGHDVADKSITDHYGTTRGQALDTLAKTVEKIDYANGRRLGSVDAATISS
jgi:integrase